GDGGGGSALGDGQVGAGLDRGVDGDGVVVGGVRLGGAGRGHVGGVGQVAAVAQGGIHGDVHGEAGGAADRQGHAARAGHVLADRAAVETRATGLEDGPRRQRVGDGDAAHVHRGSVVGDGQAVVEAGRVTGDGRGR